MNLTRSIISLSAVRHPWDVTDGMNYFKGIPTHVIILSVIEGIWCGKYAFRGGVVSEMID